MCLMIKDTYIWVVNGWVWILVRIPKDTWMFRKMGFHVDIYKVWTTKWLLNNMFIQTINIEVVVYMWYVLILHHFVACRYHLLCCITRCYNHLVYISILPTREKLDWLDIILHEYNYLVITYIKSHKL